MKMSNSTEVIQTLNSKLLFGVEVPEKVLNTLISNDTFPCLHYIYNINRLIMKPHLDKKDILNHKKIFYDNRDSFSLLTGLPEFQINEKELFNEENCLLSRFSCVNLIERIFKYGKFKNNVIYDLSDEWLTKILLLNVFETGIDEENEIEEEKNDMLNLYLSIIAYNQFPNDINNANYYRLSYIYDNYITNHLEIMNTFKTNNGYSIKSYLLFIQMFFLLGAYQCPFMESNIFNDSPKAAEIKKCIEEHIFNYESESEKNKIKINSYIPSNILIEKPIAVFDNKYLVINPGFLMSRIYGIFFNKIKSTINSKTDFNRKFYGPLFENYCRDIARIYTKKSKFEHYCFIEPFKYKVGKDDKESSDFYIQYKDTTIIFEIKSTGRFTETTTDINIEGKEIFIEEEVNQKIVKPLNQLENRLTEIMNLNASLYPNTNIDKIQKSKTFYYVIVSDESIINNYKLYNDYLTKLKTKYSKHIPLYLNISEFEYLIMSLFNRKKTIDKVLEHYYNFYYASNFTDMVVKEMKTFKFDRLDIFDHYPYSEEFKEILKR